MGKPSEDGSKSVKKIFSIIVHLHSYQSLFALPMCFCSSVRAVLPILISLPAVYLYATYSANNSPIPTTEFGCLKLSICNRGWSHKCWYRTATSCLRTRETESEFDTFLHQCEQMTKSTFWTLQWATLGCKVFIAPCCVRWHMASHGCHCQPKATLFF